MATNPQFPADKGPHDRTLHVAPRLRTPKRKKFLWPSIILLGAAAILVALIVSLPRAPKGRPGPSEAQAPIQPTPSEIQLSHFKLTAAPAGNAYYLDGLLFNNGGNQITGLQVQINFKGTNGQTVGGEIQPIGVVTDSSGANTTNLVQVPLKPGDSRRFRIYLNRPPANWNKQVPELIVTTVTGTRP